MQNHTHHKQILLVGNPNVGKSTAFNALCNTTQKDWKLCGGNGR
ncbi:GTPase [Bergeyella porcorum]